MPSKGPQTLTKNSLTSKAYQSRQECDETDPSPEHYARKEGLSTLFKKTMPSKEPHHGKTIKLSEYIARSKSPCLRGFLLQHKDSFEKWHEDPLQADKFLEVWSNRFCEIFRVIKAREIKGPKKSNSDIKEICTELCDRFRLDKERNKLKRHMEHEIIQTQTVMTTRLNKRLRQEAEEDAINKDENSQSSQLSQSTESSQESQSSQTLYVSESDSSHDNNDLLEPVVSNGTAIEAKNLAIRQLTNVELEVYATALFNLTTNHDNSFDLGTVDESLFIDLALNPFIKAVLPIGHKLQRSGHFTPLEGDSDLRPDMKFYSAIDGVRFDCLLLEVKCPRSTCKDDLYKLSVEMQLILNRFIENGANSPAVYGVLVYGFSCSIYKMNLVAPKAYTMVKIRTCFLPRCSEDFHVVVNTLSSFLQLRDLVCEQIQLIAENKHKISDILGWVSASSSLRSGRRRPAGSVSFNLCMRRRH
ncbi:hypothetical protein BY458DRAFT_561199 [Sporodiniella umbellata]|nr:hypothetical protein BY458DRAFT_561199 [Sporodiniella umbellata]